MTIVKHKFQWEYTHHFNDEEDNYIKLTSIVQLHDIEEEQSQKVKKQKRDVDEKDKQRV